MSRVAVLAVLLASGADAFMLAPAAGPRAVSRASVTAQLEPMPEPEPAPQKKKKLKTKPLDELQVFYASEPSEDPNVSCWLDPSPDATGWICAPDSILAGFRTGEESHDDAY